MTERARPLQSPGTVDWSQTTQQLTGELLLPGSNGYEAARKPAVERFHQIRPAAVLRCRSAADVVQALALAERSGLPMAIRSGGHDFAGRSSTTGLLIDLGPMTTTWVRDRRVGVGPGVQLGALYQTLHAHGRTLPAGSGLTVGIAGLTLGGGFGLLGRRHGLLADSLAAATVALPDGRVVDCDHERHPDLFWLLRGAGTANVGVVTELVFDTVPAPDCTVFDLSFHYQDAAQLVAAWQRWAPDAPDDLAASLLLTAAADPRQPPQVTVTGTAADTIESAAQHLLLGLLNAAEAQPRTSWRRSTSWLDARRWLSSRAPADDPGSHSFSKSEYFRQPLPPATVVDLVAAFTTDRVPGEARELDFSPWAGAYNNVPVDATAFPHRREQFLLKHSAIVSHRTTAPALPSSWLTRSWQTVRPSGSGGVYPNFPDPDLDDPELAYYGPNLARINQVRGAYDPTGLFSRSPAGADASDP